MHTYLLSNLKKLNGLEICTWGVYAKIAILSSSPTPFRKGVHIPLKGKGKSIDSHVPNRKGCVTWEGDPFALQETNISPQKCHFEDDFPFPKVGYVNPLEGNPFSLFPIQIRHEVV